MNRRLAAAHGDAGPLRLHKRDRRRLVRQGTTPGSSCRGASRSARSAPTWKLLLAKGKGAHNATCARMQPIDRAVSVTRPTWSGSGWTNGSTGHPRLVRPLPPHRAHQAAAQDGGVPGRQSHPLRDLARPAPSRGHRSAAAAASPYRRSSSPTTRAAPARAGSPDNTAPSPPPTTPAPSASCGPSLTHHHLGLGRPATLQHSANKAPVVRLK